MRTWYYKINRWSDVYVYESINFEPTNLIAEKAALNNYGKLLSDLDFPADIRISKDKNGPWKTYRVDLVRNPSFYAERVFE